MSDEKPNYTCENCARWDRASKFNINGGKTLAPCGNTQLVWLQWAGMVRYIGDGMLGVYAITAYDGHCESFVKHEEVVR